MVEGGYKAFLPQASAPPFPGNIGTERKYCVKKDLPDRMQDSPERMFPWIVTVSFLSLHKESPKSKFDV